MECLSDPALDLEQNLKYLSNDLCHLVDNSNNDLEFNPLGPEFNYTWDGSFSKTSTGQFPEFPPEFIPNDHSTENFFTNDHSTEDSGFMSNPNSSYDISGVFDQVSEPIPETIPQIDTYLMPNVPQQLPNLVTTWHPTYGNVLMHLLPHMTPNGYVGQYIPSMQMIQPMQPMMPYIQGNSKNHFTHHKTRRGGRTFSKQYPRRTQKGFSVVPSNKKKENHTNESLDDLVMDLRELNIGPSSLYESNQTKLMNNLSLCLQVLSRLANESIEIDCTLFKKGQEPPPTLDFTKDVTGYQFFHYWRCIVSHSKLEQVNAKATFMSLHQHFVDTVGDVGSKLVIANIGSGLMKEMHAKTELLNNLSSYDIIRDVVLDVSERPSELEVINATLKDFIKAVRSVTVCLWSLKVLFKTDQIKNFSMNIV